MLQNRAIAIKDRVRSFFEKGHKSGNKLYDMSLSCTNLAKAVKRNTECDQSRFYRLTGATSYYNIAEMLVKMKITDRSGNCGEMAGLSAYYVLKTEFIRRNLIYIGTVNDPGDHVFCLVSEAPLSKNSRAFESVTAFTKAPPAPAWMIIDPWLNVACSARNYLMDGGQKLDKWTAEGKRVAWHAGSMGATWYSPNGEYKTAFINAPLALMDF